MRMLKKRFRNLSINTKFLLSISIILLIPLMLLFLFIRTNVKERMKEQAAQTILEVVKQAKMPLSTFVRDTDYFSTQVLGNGDVQKYLRRCQSAAPETLYKYRYQVDLFLAQLLDSRPQVQRIALFVNNQVAVQSGAYLTRDSLPENMASLDLQSSGLHWGTAADNQAYLSYYERGYEVTLLRAVNDIYDFGTMLGVQKITVREEYLCSLYNTMVGPLTENIFLMNEQGEVISSQNKAWLNAHLQDDAAYQNIFGKHEGVYFLKDGRMVAFCYLKEPGWYLVRLDSNVVTASPDAVILICIVLVLLFCVVFFIIQKRSIIRPITELSEEVRSFHDGNYTFTDRRSADDEIGVLNRSCVEMGRYIQDLIERVYKSQLEEKEAQLKYLQAQINPHFLYNTLDSIRWMAVRNKQPVIAEQTQALAGLMRHALNQGRKMTTVREELEHLQDYITIQTNRFEDRIRIVVEAQPQTLDDRVMALLLQPLVENAIVHGLENKIGQGVIEVRIFHAEQDLVYIVEDNGLGADTRKIQEALAQDEPAEGSFALKNIQRRIQYQYGKAYGIRFESEKGIGTKVTVRMPIEKETDHESADCG